MKRKRQIIPPFISLLVYLLEEQLPAHSTPIKQKVTNSKIGPSLRNIVERNIIESERENRTVQFRMITSFFEI